MHAGQYWVEEISVIILKRHSRHLSGATKEDHETLRISVASAVTRTGHQSDTNEP
jgi:hypothetical protein